MIYESDFVEYSVSADANGHAESCIYVFYVFCRMSATCQKKCIAPKYRESELTKGEAVCIDRCVAKYLEVHDRIGRKLTSLSMADEEAMKKLQTQTQTPK